MLEAAYATQPWHWSPDHVHGPMDIIAGSILVQHTTWTNAERALERLRAACALDAPTILHMPDADLVELIRVSGTPQVKLRRLRAVAQTIEDAGGLEALFALADGELRARLLATHGIGPETADAIMLYGDGRRTFLIDAYTIRLFRRLGLGPDGGDAYAAWQRWFEDALPHADAAMFQRFHAHIVLHGKALCRVLPLCAACPFLADCAFGQASAGSTLPRQRAVQPPSTT
jgi:endonuclease-3 related protein